MFCIHYWEPKNLNIFQTHFWLRLEKYEDHIFKRFQQ